MYHNIKEGALLIADAHYPNHKKELFLELLNAVLSGKIKTPQLILMGDIFDLLVGESKYLKKQFKEEIELLDTIAKKVEVIYLEGNHDFNLKSLFSSVNIVPISKQPLLAKINNKTIALSHGDNYLTPLSYKLFTKFIRNRYILKILPDAIAKYKLKSMKKKRLCKDIAVFKNIVLAKQNYYNTNLIVEGHYHQGVIVGNYYALPSFACNESVAIVKSAKIEYKNLKDII